MKRRLQALCDLVEGQTCADIGCDHGYLCEMLVDKGVPEIYACEVTQKNVDKARYNIIEYVARKCQNVEVTQDKVTYDGGSVTFVLSDGFKNLQILPDCAIIAGMGGELILKILFDNLDKLPSTLVLQPNSKVEKVRTEIIKYYKICEDKIVYDCGKFYNILHLKRGQDSLTEEEILFGRTNLQTLHQDFRDYLNDLKERVRSFKTDRYENLLHQIEKVEGMYE